MLVHRITAYDPRPFVSGGRQDDPAARAHAPARKHLPRRIVVLGAETVAVIRRELYTERQEVPGRHAYYLAALIELGTHLPEDLAGGDVLQPERFPVLVQVTAGGEQPAGDSRPSFPALDRAARWQVVGVHARGRHDVQIHRPYREGPDPGNRRAQLQPHPQPDSMVLLPRRIVQHRGNQETVARTHPIAQEPGEG